MEYFVDNKNEQVAKAVGPDNLKNSKNKYF